MEKRYKEIMGYYPGHARKLSTEERERLSAQLQREARVRNGCRSPRVKEQLSPAMAEFFGI